MAMIDSPEDRSKFERLYYRCRSLMYHVAYQVLNNSQDAEDAVQSAFLKIAENMDKVDDPDSMKSTGFAVTITRNAAIDLYRKRSKENTVELTEEWVSGGEYSGMSALAGCMLKLPERQRTVLLLKYYYGYDNEEIAALLDLSAVNVARTVQRAKVKLRELCGEEEIL